jgi:small GTP-binding protein
MAALKVSLMGEGGVGKSTILSLLQKEALDGPRKPTIGVAVEKIDLGDNKVAVWDLAGQRRFQFMWDQFNQGSSVTLLVTDSTPANVLLTKDIYERHLRNSGAKVIAIANKQDLGNRMSPEDIQATLGVPTVGMVATNKMNEAAMRSMLEQALRQ